jgi:hypothetical protein
MMCACRLGTRHRGTIPPRSRGPKMSASSSRPPVAMTPPTEIVGPRPMKTLLLRGKRCVRGRKFMQSRRFFANLIISVSGEGSGIDHMIWRCRECRTKTNVLGHHMHVCVESISLEQHKAASKQRNFSGNQIRCLLTLSSQTSN